MDYFNADDEKVIPELDINLPSGWKIPLPAAEKLLRVFYDRDRNGFGNALLEVIGVPGTVKAPPKPRAPRTGES